MCVCVCVCVCVKERESSKVNEGTWRKKRSSQQNCDSSASCLFLNLRYKKQKTTNKKQVTAKQNTKAMKKVTAYFVEQYTNGRCTI